MECRHEVAVKTIANTRFSTTSMCLFSFFSLHIDFFFEFSVGLVISCMCMGNSNNKKSEKSVWESRKINGKYKSFDANWKAHECLYESNTNYHKTTIRNIKNTKETPNAFLSKPKLNSEKKNHAFQCIRKWIWFFPVLLLLVNKRARDMVVGFVIIEIKRSN